MTFRTLVGSAVLVLILASATFPAPSLAKRTTPFSGDALVTYIPVAYTGFMHGLIYYGPLRDWVGLSTLSLSFTVVDGNEVSTSEGRLIIHELLQEGVQVYAYLSEGGKALGLGSSFKHAVVDEALAGGDLNVLTGKWVDRMKSVIASYYGKVTGVFLDECDPSYFGVENPDNPYVRAFSQGLKEIVNYAHSLGLKVFVNGVRAYAAYGDLYLWEGFCSDFRNLSDGSITYAYVTDFFKTHEGDSNPYSWVNDYSKYEYLRSHGLLNRTIALSYGSPHDYGRMRACYYAARILGLRGFAYGPWDNYAGDPEVNTLFIYPLGAPLCPPSINSSSGLVAREFMDGAVSVNLTSGSVVLEELTYALPKHVVPDGSLAEWEGSLLKVTHTATTPSGDIVNVGARFDDANLYIAVRFKEPHDDPFGIFIDLGPGTSNGYRFMDIGADLYVEAYPSTSEVIGQYYIGSGDEWLWSKEVFVTRLGDSGNTSFEVVIPRYALQGSSIVKLYVVSYSRRFSVEDVEPYDAPLTITVKDGVHSLYYLTKYFMVNYSSPLKVVALCGSSTYAGFPALELKVEGSAREVLVLRLREEPSLIILSSPHAILCAHAMRCRAGLTYRGALWVSVVGDDIKEYRVLIPEALGLLKVYLVMGPLTWCACAWVTHSPTHLLPT